MTIAIMFVLAVITIFSDTSFGQRLRASLSSFRLPRPTFGKIAIAIMLIVFMTALIALLKTDGVALAARAAPDVMSCFAALDVATWHRRSRGAGGANPAVAGGLGLHPKREVPLRRGRSSHSTSAVAPRTPDTKPRIARFRRGWRTVGWRGVRLNPIPDRSDRTVQRPSPRQIATVQLTGVL